MYSTYFKSINYIEYSNNGKFKYLLDVQLRNLIGCAVSVTNIYAVLPRDCKLKMNSEGNQYLFI